MKIVAPALLRLSLALAVVSTSASATWSIVVVNTRTREVAVASATCLNNFNLKPRQAVIRVGLGAAASQATIDDGGTNRIYIWNSMTGGLAPSQMVQDLAALDPGHQGRQIGIAVLYDSPFSFTGSNTSAANPQVFGETGELRYAIQGNILAGDAVVLNAEAALIASTGDTSQRVMAAMEAARATGGDGRCSCNQPDPTACGAPPPSFTYSAFTAYIVVARPGDTEGACNAQQGCANGRYWCDLRFISGVGGLEPVLQLENVYAGFRSLMRTRADGLLTRVTPFARRLPADGVTQTTVEVELRDIDDRLLDDVRSAVVVTPIGASANFAVAGDPVFVRPGVFRFTVTSRTQVGTARFALRVLHDSVEVPLSPDLAFDVEPPAQLFSGFSAVSSSVDTVVPMTLDLGAANAGRSYLLLGSASGTTPGITFQGLALPLNSDFIFRSSYRYANTARFQNTSAALDGQGRAEARFDATAHLLDAFVGRHFDWCAIVGGPTPAITNVAGFDLGP